MNIFRISLVALAISLAACGTTTDNDGELPADLAELKSLRGQIEDDIKANQLRLDEVKMAIEKVEPLRERPKRLVTTHEIAIGEFRKFARIQGTVESKDLVTVSTEIPGRLTSVKVEEGEPVKRGQLIATVDMQNLTKQREEIEKSLELARDIYERQKRLWEQNIGSEVQYLQAKNNVERQEQSLETIDHSLSKSSIYAPITGVVDMVSLKSGEMAQPGMPIVMILNTRNLKVVADVPESYLGKVKRGEKVQIVFPAIDREMELPVSLIGRKIDPANRTFKVEMEITVNDGSIKPNLLAEVQINDYVEEDVIIISQELVQREVGGKNYVLVVEEEDGGQVARKKMIQMGESYEGDVVVMDGLESGDLLIVNGARGIAEGEAIEVITEEIVSDGE